MDADREIKHAISIGQANKEVLELAQNWCAHLTVESWGGVGMVEEMTGLPIGMRRIRCPYARAAGIAGMVLRHVALDFFDRNCGECKERRPVRLPNLLQLVEDRDAELRRREQGARLVAQREAAQVEERAMRRRNRREGSDIARDGIFDILDQLDQAPSEADHHILVDTARAAPDKFDEKMQETLFELAEAGGWPRTEAALEALATITSNRARLTQAALRALARWEAIRTAGSIVSRWLDLSQKDLLSQALPAIIDLASPIRGDVVMPGSPGDPAALLAAYRLFPDMVHTAIRTRLRGLDKQSRIHTCNAVVSILEVDPDFGPKVASDLIGSIGLPDDHYGYEGSAEGAVTRTLAEAMKVRPAEIDALVQHSLQTTTEVGRDVLFRIYTSVLRPHQWDERESSVTPVSELAFSHIIEVLTQRPPDQRFGEATRWLRDQAKYYPALLEANSETLLGAAALIAGDLDNRYSPLLDPRPTALKALEAQAREIQLSSALRTIAHTVGWAAGRQPNPIGGQIVQTLDGLSETHERLKAALVQGLGIMGRTMGGLRVALPALYAAMMDRSQQVRAAAATAYGELAETASEDLPFLVHQTFLVLILDPYVIVHSAAVRALQRVTLPPQFRADALSRIATLIRFYSTSRDNDELLFQCIERLMELWGTSDTMSSQSVQAIVAIIARMEPQVATRLIKYRSRRLRTGPGFVDLVVKLLGDPETSDSDLDDIVEELAEAPVHEIRRLTEAIQIAAAACERRGAHMTDKLLDILTTAGAWTTAVEVARAAVAKLGDTQWDRPTKLRARAQQVAAELERAAADSQTAQIVQCVATWRKLQLEIKKDDEENEEVRSPLRGLRLQSSSE